MNTIVLHVQANDPDKGRRREEIAAQVRDYFASNLPVPTDARVLCYLDDRDIDRLKELWGGGSNRGVHWPIRGHGLYDWPQDMWCTIAPADEASGEITWPYDSVIYLHGSTCKIEVQLAMTLAHELQHFLQFANQRQIWTINVLLAKLPYLPTPDLTHWCDLPTEREARIVAKRVAVNIFGKSRVDEHIGTMARANSSSEDAADWEFIRVLDCDAAYDLRAGTASLVERHRRALEELQRTTFAEDRDMGTVSLDVSR
jgi:hypothetical protein